MDRKQEQSGVEPADAIGIAVNIAVAVSPQGYIPK